MESNVAIFTQPQIIEAACDSDEVKDEVQAKLFLSMPCRHMGGVEV